jgi:hypothetical protein
MRAPFLLLAASLLSSLVATPTRANPDFEQLCAVAMSMDAILRETSTADLVWLHELARQDMPNLEPMLSKEIFSRMMASSEDRDLLRRKMDGHDWEFALQMARHAVDLIPAGKVFSSLSPFRKLTDEQTQVLVQNLLRVEKGARFREFVLYLIGGRASPELIGVYRDAIHNWSGSADLADSGQPQPLNELAIEQFLWDRERTGENPDASSFERLAARDPGQAAGILRDILNLGGARAAKLAATFADPGLGPLPTRGSGADPAILYSVLEVAAGWLDRAAAANVLSLGVGTKSHFVRELYPIYSQFASIADENADPRSLENVVFRYLKLHFNRD